MGQRTPESIVPQTGAAARVLVVEDESIIAYEIARCLTEAGFAVCGPAASAAEALRLLAHDEVGAVVLDVGLRDGSCEEVATLLTGRGTPFVVITGYGRDELAPALRTAPLIAKPFRTDRLVLEVRRLLKDS